MVFQKEKHKHLPDIFKLSSLINAIKKRSLDNYDSASTQNSVQIGHNCKCLSMTSGRLVAFFLRTEVVVTIKLTSN